MTDYGATFERYTLGLNQQRLLEYIAECARLQTETYLLSQGIGKEAMPPFPEMLHFDRHTDVEWRSGKGPRSFFGRRKKVATKR